VFGFLDFIVSWRDGGRRHLRFGLGFILHRVCISVGVEERFLALSKIFVVSFMGWF